VIYTLPWFTPKHLTWHHGFRSLRIPIVPKAHVRWALREEPLPTQAELRCHELRPHDMFMRCSRGWFDFILFHFPLEQINELPRNFEVVR
jgi:hypothetical protein